MAQVVLSGLFINAVMATILLGFGMSAVFSEAELLRYPLRERERFLARHLLGIMDPFWMLVLIVELGLVFGMYLWGAYSLGYGTSAALLLFVCGYLLALAIGAVIEGLMATRWGSSVVMLLILSIAILPRMIVPVLERNPAARNQVLSALRFTPSFGAAAAMTHTGGTAFAGLGLIALWCIGLGLLFGVAGTTPRGAAAAGRCAAPSPARRISSTGWRTVPAGNRAAGELLAALRRAQ